MTEQEWLTSDDPLAMLGHLTRWPTGDESGGRATHPHHPGDRKLRLFACACCRQVPSVMAVDGVSEAVAAAECFADGLSTSKDRGLAMNSADLIPGGPLQARSRAYACLRSDATQGAYEAISLIGGDKTASAQAAILRDIAGNPWRPVEIAPDCYECNGRGRWAQGYQPDFECPECDGAGKRPCPWLTPTVVSLAQAAYDERVAPCGRCGGSGTLLDIEDFDTDARTEESCDRCHGTGIIDDGTLDPVRLAILADALEEAGCPAEEGAECPDCSPYKDDPDNHWPGKLGYRPARDVASGRHEGGWGNCYRCNGGGKGHWRPGFVLLPNPLLAHIRSPDPHVRGCWAVDMILGKE